MELSLKHSPKTLLEAWVAPGNAHAADLARAALNRMRALQLLQKSSDLAAAASSSSSSSSSSLSSTSSPASSAAGAGAASLNVRLDPAFARSMRHALCTGVSERSANGGGSDEMAQRDVPTAPQLLAWAQNAWDKVYFSSSRLRVMNVFLIGLEFRSSD